MSSFSISRYFSAYYTFGVRVLFISINFKYTLLSCSISSVQVLGQSRGQADVDINFIYFILKIKDKHARKKIIKIIEIFTLGFVFPILVVYFLYLITFLFFYG